MTILWINLAIVFIFSFFARYFATPKISEELTFYRPNVLLCIGALLSLVTVSGLRKNIGDTYFYKLAYQQNNFGWERIGEQQNVGFWLFQKFLHNFSNDPQILILVAAVITNGLIIIIFYKYSRMFELSTYLYITGGTFLVSMNGLRQTMVAAIIFAATKYLIKRNWLKYFLVVLVCSTIHESAFVLIPIYFIVKNKAWSKTTFILLLSSIFIVIGYDKFSSVLFSSIQDTQYGHYENFQEGGANIYRVLVYAVPVIIAYFGKEKLRELFPESDYIVNMALIGLLFMIVSLQNWIFARFTIYFELYQIILMSWVVKLFREQDQRFVYFGILVCFLFYHYYENVITLNINYHSAYLHF